MIRKNRPRRLTIESGNYLWRIQRLDEQYVVLRVWAENRSRRDFPLEVRLRFDDFWLNFGSIISATPEQRQKAFQYTPITPGMVREIIEAALAMGWKPLSPIKTQRFEWTDVKKLIPINN
jgi:hypothetical protein